MPTVTPLFNDTPVVTLSLKAPIQLASTDRDIARGLRHLRGMLTECWMCSSLAGREAFVELEDVRDLYKAAYDLAPDHGSWRVVDSLAAVVETRARTDLGTSRTALLGMMLDRIWSVMTHAEQRAAFASDAASAPLLADDQPPLAKAEDVANEGIDHDEWMDVLQAYGLDDSFQYTAQQRADFANMHRLDAMIEDLTDTAQNPAKRPLFVITAADVSAILDDLDLNYGHPVFASKPSPDSDALAEKLLRMLDMVKLDQANSQAEAHAVDGRQATPQAVRSEVVAQLLNAGIANRELSEMELVARDLECGVSADIWYDAAQHGDTAAYETIERVQAAMSRAAAMLRTSAEFARQGRAEGDDGTERPYDRLRG